MFAIVAWPEIKHKPLYLTVKWMMLVVLPVAHFVQYWFEKIFFQFFNGIWHITVYVYLLTKIKFLSFRHVTFPPYVQLTSGYWAV